MAPYRVCKDLPIAFNRSPPTSSPTAPAHAPQESLQAQVHLLQQQLLSSSASSQRTVLADTLQWAMSHAYVGRFKYLDASTSTAIDDLYMSCQELGLGFRAGGCEKTSKRLVQDMLIKFMRDEGFWIPNALHIPQAADAGSSQVRGSGQ